MENDAISRSAMLDFLTNNIAIREDEIDLMEEVCHTIKAAPSLDVAPVVHARWVPSWEPLDLSDVYFRCSACHTNFNVGTEIDMEMAKYCPK